MNAISQLQWLLFGVCLGCLGTVILWGRHVKLLHAEREALHARNSRLTAHRDQLRDMLRALTINPTLPAIRSNGARLPSESTSHDTRSEE